MKSYKELSSKEKKNYEMQFLYAAAVFLLIILSVFLDYYYEMELSFIAAIFFFFMMVVHIYFMKKYKEIPFVRLDKMIERFRFSEVRNESLEIMILSFIFLTIVFVFLYVGFTG